MENALFFTQPSTKAQLSMPVSLKGASAVHSAQRDPLWRSSDHNRVREGRAGMNDLLTQQTTSRPHCSHHALCIVLRDVCHVWFVIYWGCESNQPLRCPVHGYLVVPSAAILNANVAADARNVPEVR